jgi:hypothetical protein
MAAYGWEMYGANGGVVTNDSSLNCFYLAHYISPGNGSYSKAFYDYAYSDIQVMCGGAVVPAFAAAPPTSSTVTYASNGVPTVTISDSGSNGGTYWITCSRIDPRSVLGSGYGINLYDALNGVAFPAGSSPFVFIGKGQYRFGLNSGSGFRGEPAVGGGVGVSYIETDSPVPPLCFWRSSEIDGETMHALPQFGASVKKSEIAPTRKAYRWALGVTLEDGTSEYTIGGAPYLHMAYCFQPIVNNVTSGYGVGVYKNASNGVALTDEIILNINKHVIDSSQLKLSGKHLKILVSSSNPAMLPLYSYRKYVPPGSAASKFYVVYWYPSNTPGYIFGRHIMGVTRKGYATAFSDADRTAEWYRDIVLNNGMATHVIDVNKYN